MTLSLRKLRSVLIGQPKVSRSGARLPPYAIGGMAYVRWHFDTSDIHQLVHEVNVLTEAARGSDLYLAVYEGNIGSDPSVPSDDHDLSKPRHCYWGLQTSNDDADQLPQAIFSAWGLTDKRDIRGGPDTLVFFPPPTDPEGVYFSLRHKFASLPVGRYTTRMQRAEEERGGDWFDYYVTTADSIEHYIGGMRFARQQPDVPARIQNGVGGWLEFWDNSTHGLPIYPVPSWSVEMAAHANGAKAVAALGFYSADENGHSMPQSNLSAGSNTVRFDVGEDVVRVREPGLLWGDAASLDN